MSLLHLTEKAFRNSPTAKRIFMVGLAAASMSTAEEVLAQSRSQSREKIAWTQSRQETYDVIFPFKQPKTRRERKRLEKVGPVKFMEEQRMAQDLRVAKALASAYNNPGPGAYSSMLETLVQQRKLTEYIALKDVEKFNLTRATYQGTRDPNKPLPKPVFYQKDQNGNLISLGKNNQSAQGGSSGYKWITSKGRYTEIDVTKAVSETSSKHSDFIGDQQRIINRDKSITSLFYHGSYEGNSGWKNVHRVNGNDKMRVYKRMDPNDGVIEGFALARQEAQGKWAFYLFVDEDWVNQSKGNLNVVWVGDRTKRRVVRSRNFDFSNKQNGVYIDKITQDISWFDTKNHSVAAIFFGEITRKDIEKGRYNKNFIMID